LINLTAGSGVTTLLSRADVRACILGAYVSELSLLDRLD